MTTKVFFARVGGLVVAVLVGTLVVSSPSLAQSYTSQAAAGTSVDSQPSNSPPSSALAASTVVQPSGDSMSVSATNSATNTVSSPAIAAAHVSVPTNASPSAQTGASSASGASEPTAAKVSWTATQIPASISAIAVDKAAVKHSDPAQIASTGAKAGAKAAFESFLSMTLLEKRKYESAAATFPAFCQDWERRLRERELDNLTHVAWQQRNGYQTATYVGYSKVESCETKPAVHGLAIGKLRYEEESYYLVGKTIDEARQATPKLIGVTNTLEIFSWEKNRWFY
jgi:hypothetical protein